MVSKTLKIINPMGMHMRPANEFVKLVSQYPCDVTIVSGGKTVNGKSIMNLMAACLKAGSEFELQCSGPEEEACLEAAGKFVESGLGE